MLKIFLNIVSRRIYTQNKCLKFVLGLLSDVRIAHNAALFINRDVSALLCSPIYVL